MSEWYDRFDDIFAEVVVDHPKFNDPELRKRIKSSIKNAVVFKTHHRTMEREREIEMDTKNPFNPRALSHVTWGKSTKSAEARAMAAHLTSSLREEFYAPPPKPEPETPETRVATIRKNNRYIKE